MAASIRRIISFPAPRRFHPGTCKRRQGISDWSSITPSSTAAAANPRSSAAFNPQRSCENHPPPKPRLRQIPIDRQALIAFPRVRSSEAFRRRPPIPRSIAGARPASETLTESGRLPDRSGDARFNAHETFPTPTGGSLGCPESSRPRQTGRRIDDGLTSTRRAAASRLSGRRCRSLR